MGVGSGTVSVQYKSIASNSTFTTTLTELRKYVQYNIQVRAFTRLGDGELSSPPVRVRTFEDSKYINHQIFKFPNWHSVMGCEPCCTPTIVFMVS